VSDLSVELDDDDLADESEGIRVLRQKAKRTDVIEAELHAANRKIAILEAGLDVESPVGELFVKVYDGETSPEALRAAADKYGIPIKGWAAGPLH
jgi:hypothetical protein